MAVLQENRCISSRQSPIQTSFDLLHPHTTLILLCGHGDEFMGGPDVQRSVRVQGGAYWPV
jgi:hypothetical protein